jgi:hypothetical protein
VNRYEQLVAGLGQVRFEESLDPEGVRACLEALRPDAVSPGMRRLIEAGQLPGLEALVLREQMVKRFAWSIPNAAAIKAIATFSPAGVVEVGAGTGYWASLLAAEMEVHAYDRRPYRNPYCDGRYFRVLRAGPDAAAFHGQATLLLSWPCRGDDMALETLMAHSGQRLVFIGEFNPDVCANAAFYAELQHTWSVERVIELPRWAGFKVVVLDDPDQSNPMVI